MVRELKCIKEEDEEGKQPKCKSPKQTTLLSQLEGS